MAFSMWHKLLKRKWKCSTVRGYDARPPGAGTGPLLLETLETRCLLSGIRLENAERRSKQILFAAFMNRQTLGLLPRRCGHHSRFVAVPTPGKQLGATIATPIDSARVGVADRD